MSEGWLFYKKSRHERYIVRDDAGGDGEIRPPRFCARRHAPGHRNSPPDCFYAAHCPFRISHYKKTGTQKCTCFFMAETARFELAGDCSLTDFEFSRRLLITWFLLSVSVSLVRPQTRMKSGLFEKIARKY